MQIMKKTIENDGKRPPNPKNQIFIENRFLQIFGIFYNEKIPLIPNPGPDFLIPSQIGAYSQRTFMKTHFEKSHFPDDQITKIRLAGKF